MKMAAASIALEPVASEAVRLNSWLDDVSSANGLDRRVAADFKLCLNEIFANLISYALKDTKNPSIEIEVRIAPGSAAATVSDNGPVFDISEWTPAPPPEDLASATPGGLGIVLLRALARRIDYERVGEINKLSIECG
jgi:anti-sigma regulatory factor (Ser/Thr protein kinase)